MKRIWEFIKNASQSRTTALLVILVIAAAVPLTVLVAQKQQNYQQKAYDAGHPCSAQKDSVRCNMNGCIWTALPVTDPEAPTIPGICSEPAQSTPPVAQPTVATPPAQQPASAANWFQISYQPTWNTSLCPTGQPCNFQSASAVSVPAPTALYLHWSANNNSTCSLSDTGINLRSATNYGNGLNALPSSGDQLIVATQPSTITINCGGQTTSVQINVSGSSPATTPPASGGGGTGTVASCLASTAAHNYCTGTSADTCTFPTRDVCTSTMNSYLSCFNSGVTSDTVNAFCNAAKITSGTTTGTSTGSTTETPSSCSQKYFSCDITSGTTCLNSSKTGSNCLTNWTNYFTCTGSSASAASTQAQSVCAAGSGTATAPTPTAAIGTLTFTIGLDGVGKTGDQKAPGARTPIANERSSKSTIQATILISDGKTAIPGGTITGVTLTYDGPSGKYIGPATIPAAITGTHDIRIQIPGHLIKKLGATTGVAQTLPGDLIAGDVNMDGSLGVTDVTTLVACWLKGASDSGCLGHNADADINVDGTVDQFDYNLWLREFAVLGTKDGD